MIEGALFEQFSKSNPASVELAAYRYRWTILSAGRRYPHTR